MAPAMREIHASEANTPRRQRLDAAERGETVAIPRRGRAIAPDGRRRRAQIDAAIEILDALRLRAGTITLDELLSARRAGRK
jgi:antitoxin (DNA-binding transcriptional repressor) of toxin-antitoxin stability system